MRLAGQSRGQLNFKGLGRHARIDLHRAARSYQNGRYYSPENESGYNLYLDLIGR